MNPTFRREHEASRKQSDQLAAEGIVQFDGDPHWDRAIAALAQEAIDNVERARAAASQTHPEN